MSIVRNPQEQTVVATSQDTTVSWTKLRGTVPQEAMSLVLSNVPKNIYARVQGSKEDVYKIK